MNINRDRGLVASIRESNRQGLDAWDRFEPHRRRLHSMLLDGRPHGASSLCVLGPGNVNDVDLRAVVEHFATVHLVDVDTDSVVTAVARQGLAGDTRLRVHGPTDLTGIVGMLAAFRAGDDVDPLLTRLRDHRCAVAGAPFDVTVSAGLLSQLLQSVVEAGLPADDSVRVRLSLRDKHLADLVQLTRPGGRLLLVSDVVATSTAPFLDAAGDLMTGLETAVATRNFFTGTNPFRIVALLEEDARFRDHVAAVELTEPWMWAVTPDRRHLTYAIVARRARAVPARQSARSNRR